MKIKEITCRDAIHSIPHFMDHTLTKTELREFMHHIENCPECKEELSIQYLVKQGLEELDDNGPIDLQADLERTLSEAKDSIRKHIRFRNAAIIAELLAMVALIVVLVLSLI